MGSETWKIDFNWKLFLENCDTVQPIFCERLLICGLVAIFVARKSSSNSNQEFPSRTLPPPPSSPDCCSSQVWLKKQSLAMFSHKPAEKWNQHRIDGRGSDRIFLHNWLTNQNTYRDWISTFNQLQFYFGDGVSKRQVLGMGSKLSWGWF